MRETGSITMEGSERAMKWDARWLRAGLVLALVSLVGCDDDDPVEPQPGDEPGLEFEYDGARSGTYRSDDAEPTIGSNGLPEFGSWAVARPDSIGGLVIAAFEPTGDETGDVFILQLLEIRTGVFEPCGIFASGGCHGRFFIGVVLDDLAMVEEAFEIMDGRVEITEVSAERVRGVFEATFENPDGSRTITVTDGVIDVPFSEDPFLGGGIACLARNLEAGTNELCT